MPRPRTPTAVLELNGSFKKNPQRRADREGEPIVTGPIGHPPRGLPPEVRACWREIVACCPPGVLTAADRIAVRSAARLLAAENAGTILAVERGQLHRLLDSLGLTPRGRTYVKVPPPKPDGGRFLEI